MVETQLWGQQGYPTLCHRTRLVYLALALPLYPVLYTYVALYPESNLARHTQPNPLIPNPITWQQAPETWQRLVRDISWRAFAEPQFEFHAGGRREGESPQSPPKVRRTDLS